MKAHSLLAAVLLLLLPLSGGRSEAQIFRRCPGQVGDSCLTPQERYDHDLYRSGRPGGSVLPRQLYREQLGPRYTEPGYIPAEPSAPSFGESYRANIRLSEARPKLTVVTRLDEVAPYIAQCFSSGLDDGKLRQVTMRLIFRADGSLISPPHITFGIPKPDDHAQEAFVNGVVDAISRCTPLPLGGGFEKAIAGRPYLIRFISGVKKETRI